jgi:hypothetical protein
LIHRKEARMPRGEKSKYAGKQERKAEHIEESYDSRGAPENEAERRAWATVNEDDGGGKKPGGSGRGKRTWTSCSPAWWKTRRHFDCEATRRPAVAIGKESGRHAAKAKREELTAGALAKATWLRGRT